MLRDSRASPDPTVPVGSRRTNTVEGERLSWLRQSRVALIGDLQSFVPIDRLVLLVLHLAGRRFGRR